MKITKKYFTRVSSWLCLCILVLSMLASSSMQAEDPSGWEQISDKDNFITHRKQVEGSDIFAFRGETVVDVHISKIMSVFFDPTKRKDWVNMFGEQLDLENKDMLDKIYWIRFKTPIIMSDRDYVLQLKGEIDDQAKTMTAHIHSVTHPKKDIDSCCVRAQAFGTYYRFEALDGGKTRLKVEVHTDPKGWIPSLLVNFIQKNWPRKTLLNLARVAKSDGIESHPRFADWGNPSKS